MDGGVSVDDCSNAHNQQRLGKHYSGSNMAWQVDWRVEVEQERDSMAVGPDPESIWPAGGGLHGRAWPWCWIAWGSIVWESDQTGSMHVVVART